MSQAKQKGFTIIELLIVIVVIGILATITAVALGGANERARDAKRESDAKSLQTALEAYYTIGNSQYPTLAQFNDATFRTDNFQGVTDDTFQDPNATDSQLAAAPAANVYSYEVAPAGCDNDPAVGGICTDYTLTVTLEGSPDPIVKTNLQ